MKSRLQKRQEAFNCVQIPQIIACARDSASDTNIKFQIVSMPILTVSKSNAEFNGSEVF